MLKKGTASVDVEGFSKGKCVYYENFEIRSKGFPSDVEMQMPFERRAVFFFRMCLRQKQQHQSRQGPERPNVQNFPLIQVVTSQGR